MNFASAVRSMLVSHPSISKKAFTLALGVSFVSSFVLSNRFIFRVSPGAVHPDMSQYQAFITVDFPIPFSPEMSVLLPNSILAERPLKFDNSRLLRTISLAILIDVLFICLLFRLCRSSSHLSADMTTQKAC